MKPLDTIQKDLGLETTEAERAARLRVLCGGPRSFEVRAIRDLIKTLGHLVLEREEMERRQKKGIPQSQVQEEEK